MANTQRVELAMSPQDAYEAVKSALAEAGRVKDANPTTRRLVGKVKYGLATVDLRIAVLSGPTADASVLEIDPKGRDVWGSGARKGVDKLVAAIR